MPKKVSEFEKKKIIDSFLNGITIDQLSKKYNFSKITISRHLKNALNTKVFQEIVKKNNTKNSKELNNIDDTSINDSNKKISQEKMDCESPFYEIPPLIYEIDNEPQKDLASVSILNIELPKIVYMIVDSKIELEIKPLREYPEWQFLSHDELNKKTIEIFFDMKIAKRFCSKQQKVIKVPNTNVFKIAAKILLSRGITRIVSPENLISL